MNPGTDPHPRRRRGHHRITNRAHPTALTHTPHPDSHYRHRPTPTRALLTTARYHSLRLTIRPAVAKPPLTLGLGIAAIATLWGLAALLAALPIAYVAARAILARRAAPVAEAVRGPTVSRCAITTGLALILAAFAGWLFLSTAPTAPLAQADTAGKASDAGLQRDTIATNHAVSQAFPQIEQIGGFRPDPLPKHDEGLALDIPVPDDPTNPEGIALGHGIRDFRLTRAAELGIDHVLWRRHIYSRRHIRADGRPRQRPRQPHNPPARHNEKRWLPVTFTPRHRFRLNHHERTSTMNDLGLRAGAPVVHRAIGGAR